MPAAIGNVPREGPPDAAARRRGGGDMSAPTLEYNAGRKIQRAPVWLPSRQQVPFLITLVVCVLLYVAAGWRYPSFFKPYTIVNLLVNENAMLGIVAIGLTFVILSG